MNDQERAALIERFLEGGLSDFDTERLCTELENTPAQLNELLDQSCMHQRLSVEYASRTIDDAVMNALQSRPEQEAFRQRVLTSLPRRKHWLSAVVLIAASLLVAVVLSRQFFGMRASAYVSGQSVCVWRGESYMPVTVLNVGDRVESGEETAQITLHDGSLITLEPQTQLVCQSLGQAAILLLKQGCLEATITPQQHSFAIHTPALHVSVLGTHFTVVHQNQTSFVHVHEGRVAVADDDEQQAIELVSGESASVLQGKLIGLGQWTGTMEGFGEKLLCHLDWATNDPVLEHFRFYDRVSLNNKMVLRSRFHENGVAIDVRHDLDKIALFTFDKDLTIHVRFKMNKRGDVTVRLRDHNTDGRSIYSIIPLEQIHQGVWQTVSLPMDTFIESRSSKRTEHFPNYFIGRPCRALRFKVFDREAELLVDRFWVTK